MFNQMDFGTDTGIVPIDTSLFPSNDPFTPQVVDYAFGGDITAGFSVPPAGITQGYHDPVYDVPIVIDESTNAAPDVFDVLTKAALAAIKINAAYQASKGPVRINSNPASGNPVPTTGGMLITRNPLTGAVQTTRPPVGAVYVLADGRSLINNGDGSFSLITPNGQEIRKSYSDSTAGAGETNWLLYGALGLGTLMLLNR